MSWLNSDIRQNSKLLISLWEHWEHNGCLTEANMGLYHEQTMLNQHDLLFVRVTSLSDCGSAVGVVP